MPRIARAISNSMIVTPSVRRTGNHLACHAENFDVSHIWAWGSGKCDWSPDLPELNHINVTSARECSKRSLIDDLRAAWCSSRCGRSSLIDLDTIRHRARRRNCGRTRNSTAEIWPKDRITGRIGQRNCPITIVSLCFAACILKIKYKLRTCRLNSSPLRFPKIKSKCDCAQNTNNGHHNQQFDQRETRRFVLSHSS